MGNNRKSRSRSISGGISLEAYHDIVDKIILQDQDSVTGLLPASHDNHHAWIRDNVYSISAVWALSLAYRKAGSEIDEDRAKAYELEQSTVKCMRGLLTAMIRQRVRVERFQETNAPIDSIHAKFSSKTGLPVVGDAEWGHLQIDAISLYLLTLAQMTASGLQIIYTLDEVNFVQNLVFFIESAYCIPDYGIWERGDKTNTGKVELNSSSIGMAKAALEALNGLDLFGSRGSPNSIIYVMEDEIHKCRTVLESMLPRESLSKETDAALLTVIGFPAFAVENESVIDKTFEEIALKLAGKFGCKRFLRDGYRNPREDPNRLHYEPWELQMFENIECQWPLFFCYIIITHCYREEFDKASDSLDALEKLMIESPEGDMRYVPELYTITMETLFDEQKNPGSQDRVVVGRSPFMWAQALYVIGCLLQQRHIAPGELDPLNRRLSKEKKPDVVVQVVVLAKNKVIQDLLATSDINVLTVDEVGPIEVHPAKILSELFTYLGRNEKLGLKGRHSRDIGVLATSHLYKIQDKLFAFTPQKFDATQNYMDSDMSLMMSTLEHGLNYLATCWRKAGRPLITLILDDHYLNDGRLHPVMVNTLRKIKSGYIEGTRVSFGTFDQFMSTTVVRNLSFLHCNEDGQSDKLIPKVETALSVNLGTTFVTMKKMFHHKRSPSPDSSMKSSAMRGAIKRSRSLKMVDSYQSLLSEETRRRRSIVKKQESIDESPERQINFQNNQNNSQYNSQYTGAKRNRMPSESVYSDHELEDLVQLLANAQSLDEQGDILYHLHNCFGMKKEIKYRSTEGEKCVNVKDLVEALYSEAMAKRNWGIVRHSAGVLGKRVDDLSKAVTDLIVRQKQVTVGMPAEGEVILSGGKLTSKELRQIIHDAYPGAESMAMLTQELMIYLAMFISSEPQLFHGMLRLRVGLIIQVMASELSRSLRVSDEDASEDLINLSPFEMRNLLHHIMSGREFGVHAVPTGYSIVCDRSTVSKKYIQKVRKSSREDSHAESDASREKDLASKMDVPKMKISDDENQDSDDSDDDGEQRGSWMRRRRLDGALNRVPLGFYSTIHSVLEKCQGGIQMQEKNKLEYGLTQEMTRGETKFALQVELNLNTIPQPEFRQLMVEALIVLGMVVEHNIVASFWTTVNVEKIVMTANRLFLEDQLRAIGDATLCCATEGAKFSENSKDRILECGGSAGICKHFYDSAPSGNFGTMTYMVRSCCHVLEEVPNEGDIECSIS